MNMLSNIINVINVMKIKKNFSGNKDNVIR